MTPATQTGLLVAGTVVVSAGIGLIHARYIYGPTQKQETCFVAPGMTGRYPGDVGKLVGVVVSVMTAIAALA